MILTAFLWLAWLAAAFSVLCMIVGTVLAIVFLIWLFNEIKS